MPVIARDILLAHLVGVAAQAAGWIRAQWEATVSLLTAVANTGTRTTSDQVGWRLPNPRQLLVGVASLPGLLVERLRRAKEYNDKAARSPDEAQTQSRPLEPAAGEFDIRQAWAWLARQTAEHQAGSRTPEDIAEDAVDHGYPREAVHILLDSFRDVTYGEFPPTGDRIESARCAFEKLRVTDRSPVDGEGPS